MLSLCSCGGGSDGDGNGGDGNGGGPTDDTISMITPYVNRTDISSIDSTFSTHADMPWGEAHSGIDFSPAENLIPFQAVCSGEIESVELLRNTSWVEVTIRYNSQYSVLYVFEPMTGETEDGETQLANISVSEGESVSQGDIIGYLYAVGEGPHVHFSLFNSDPQGLCPESYFTTEARESILEVLHDDHPDWDMCYE